MIHFHNLAVVKVFDNKAFGCLKKNLVLPVTGRKYSFKPNLYFCLTECNCVCMITFSTALEFFMHYFFKN